MGAHGTAQLCEVCPDVARAQHQHAGIHQRRHRPQVAPGVITLQVAIARQALHTGQQHRKEMLAHGLAVRARGAAQRDVCRHKARRQVVVVAGRVKLQQLEIGGGSHALGRQVAHHDVSHSQLLVAHRGQAGAQGRLRAHRRARSHIGEGCLGKALLQQGLVLLSSRQQNQHVHKVPLVSRHAASARSVSPS